MKQDLLTYITFVRVVTEWAWRTLHHVVFLNTCSPFVKFCTQFTYKEHKIEMIHKQYWNLLQIGSITIYFLPAKLQRRILKIFKGGGCNKYLCIVRPNGGRVGGVEESEMAKIILLIKMFSQRGKQIPCKPVNIRHGTIHVYRHCVPTLMKRQCRSIRNYIVSVPFSKLLLLMNQDLATPGHVRKR